MPSANPYAPPAPDPTPNPSKLGSFARRALAIVELLGGGLVALLGLISLGLLIAGGATEAEVRFWFSGGLVLSTGALVMWAAWCLDRGRYRPQLVLLLLPALPVLMTVIN